MVCVLHAVLLSTLVASTGTVVVPATTDSSVNTQKVQWEYYFDQGVARVGGENGEDGTIVDYVRFFDGHQIRLRKLEVPTSEGVKRFDVLVITQREGSIRPADTDAKEALEEHSLLATSFVPNLFTHIRDFVYRTYANRAGTANGDLVLRTLQSERDFLNGVSTIVVITDENDLSKIHATFRIVRRGGLPENERLDIESNLEKNKLPAFEELPVSVIDYQGQKVVMGDLAELKTLAVDNSLRIDFVPYLLRSLDAHAMYSFGERRRKHQGEMLPWGASQLVIEADPSRAKLYERLYGFVVDPLRSTPELLVLTLSVEDFLKAIRSGNRNDNPAVQDYVSRPPVIAWSPMKIPSLEARRAAQEELFKNELFQENDRELVRLRNLAEGAIPLYSIEGRLDAVLRMARNRNRTPVPPVIPSSSVPEGFARPDPEQPVFESRAHLHMEILSKPAQYPKDLLAAIEFALAHRHEHPEFDLPLAQFLTVENAKYVYQIFGVEPSEQETEAEDAKIRREDAINLLAKIYSSLHKSPPEDKKVLREIAKLLRHAEIPYWAGRLYLKLIDRLPRIGQTERESVIKNALFYRDSVKDALKIVAQAKEIHGVEIVNEWFKEGYTARFSDESWDVPALIRTVLSSSAPHHERKEAAERLREYIELGKEAEYVMKVLRDGARRFSERLEESHKSLMKILTDAKKAYSEWEQLEIEVRRALKARSRFAACETIVRTAAQ